ncbi:recombination regulator RecX [Yersinia similis]|uniref:Regulatory protein RecX n=1 Tax=Yersinia similis TaxID=367190 RepID=A0A0T9R2D5_9GAMM|nr:recombination regulator RecX [Yersinia similis]AHK20038.1 recombinase RecX [Yersinia similis]CFQ64555.1 recombination regulator RecX [Yersinia similis]CNB93510.1 recombination regulator RecX [Yersinia similis]CNF18918.1 recombination regulator RecX [Yersinia similis]CNG23106.1 recombination regulator RecX [Yersinia similis]
MNDQLSRAMRLLSQRDHSESELRRKLAVPPFSAKGNWGKGSGGKSSDVVESNLVESNLVENKLVESNAIEESDPQVIEQVIDYCYQHNWLDDSRFAVSYIKSRSRKGYGVQRIRSELMQKGVDKERILAAFENSEIDWCQLAKEVAQRKFSETLPVEWKEKAKVQRYLLYRGFFQEEIQSIYTDSVE